MTVETPSNSKHIFDRSREVIPGGVNSPVRAFKGLDTEPLVVQQGQGAIITDVDGKEYIDYCLSWGALLHGHAHPKLVERVCRRVKQGSSFGIATQIEEQLARSVCDAFPSIEQVRFVSSGTEATMSAVRLARGYTKRPLIVKFNGNYHGHADAFLIQAGSGVNQLCHEASSEGVPQGVVNDTLSLPYNDIQAVSQLLQDPHYSNQIAAVILEPIAANMGVVPANVEFLNVVREETQRIGALLIFDEVISGFRVEYGGAQTLNGIVPDLTCLGKIVGGGFPAAAFGGREEIMQHLAPQGGVYQAGTLAGNPVAMEAGLATLELARSPHFYSQLENTLDMIIHPVKECLAKKRIQACIQHVQGMFTLFWGVRKVSCFEDLAHLDHMRFKRYFRFMLQRGIYVSPSPYEACFISAAHTDEQIIRTRDLMLECIEQC